MSLEDVRARAEAYAERGTPGLNAPKDRAKLLAALGYVEALCEASANLAGDGEIPMVRVDSIRIAIREHLK